jgi:hypothetical protein
VSMRMSLSFDSNKLVAIRTVCVVRDVPCSAVLADDGSSLLQRDHSLDNNNAMVLFCRTTHEKKVRENSKMCGALLLKSCSRHPQPRKKVKRHTRKNVRWCVRCVTLQVWLDRILHSMCSYPTFVHSLCLVFAK